MIIEGKTLYYMVLKWKNISDNIIFSSNISISNGDPIFIEFIKAILKMNVTIFQYILVIFLPHINIQ